MSQTGKQKNLNRGQRHSAAWGKRASRLLLPLLLVATTGMAQDWADQDRPESSPAGKFSADLAPALARAQRGAKATDTVQVIVQYKLAPRAVHEARVQGLGGRLNQRLGLVSGLAATVPVSKLAELEADPDVSSISVDHPVKGMDDFTDAAMNVSAAVNAGYDGTGIGVAVIDSGINSNHVDFWDKTGAFNRVVYHQDFTGTTQKNAQGSLVYDTYGHGTHVAGIIGGTGYMSSGRFNGVATNVNLIDLRVLNALGAGSDSNVIAAIQQAIALKGKYNIRVINLSLGRGIYTPYANDPLCQGGGIGLESGHRGSGGGRATTAGSTFWVSTATAP
jgi:serine protease AprX